MRCLVPLALALASTTAGAVDSPSDRPPGGLPPDLETRLVNVSVTYMDAALKFTCKETIRRSRYDSSGEAKTPKNRLFDYLLTATPGDNGVEEYRGGAKPRDTGNIPPPLAWAFMFHDRYRPYFDFRDRGVEQDGYDVVRNIDFRGALPAGDGRDIREWEGTITLHAETLLPLRVSARPRGQRERLSAKYAKEQRALEISFIFQGFPLVSRRVAKKTLGRRCEVRFELQRTGLTLPRELRVETFRTIDRRDGTRPFAVSVSEYDDYRFFETGTTETIAPTTPPPRPRRP